MWTTPLMRTVLRAPIRAPLKTEAPVATKTLSSTVQPERWAWGPTRTWSPSRSGWVFVPRRTACSITTQCLPRITGPPSAVSTAPKRMRLSGPIVTSPETVALGAT